VDDCGVVATTNKVEFTVDHTFSPLGKHSNVVGQCFMEVYFQVDVDHQCKHVNLESDLSLHI
jgi:hypothetical protein